MSASRLGSSAALLGGLVWVVAAVLEWGAEPNRGLYLAGLGLMLLALAAGGYALVATAPIWLRLVVTVATPALGSMVWLTVYDAITDRHIALLGGGMALLLYAGSGLSRRRRQEADGQEEPGGRGSHAAR